MNLKQYLLILMVFGTLVMHGQSFFIGPYVEVGSYPYLGSFSTNRISPNEINVTISNPLGYELGIRPGLFTSLYFNNGMILDVNARLLSIEQPFLTDPDLESDGYYRFRIGTEVYLPIQKLTSEKTKLYYGFGAGYVAQRTGVKGINALEGFASSRSINGVFLSGHFRFDINFTNWFTLTPRANLMLTTVGFEKRREQPANDSPNQLPFVTNTLDFTNALNPSLGVGAIFKIFDKK